MNELLINQTLASLGLRKAFDEFRRHQTIPYGEAISNLFKRRNLSHEWIPQERWKEWKKSDTVFLFGSGPSINQLTPRQWDIIRSHDSFGLNFAFLCRSPFTYFYLGYEPSSKASTEEAFSADIRALYQNSLWFLPAKVLFRLVHPRLKPEFFPPHVKLALFNLPSAIQLDDDRPFTPEDFQKGLLYRGAMGVGLHLADLMGYEKIVLLGVDLHTHRHFFDNHEVMKKEREAYNRKMSAGKVFESMIPKGNKYRTMEEYYYALNEIYFYPKGVRLFVGNEGNMLNPRLPFYPGFQNIGVLQ